MAERSARSGPLARVEGEGSLHVRLRDGRVEEVRLEIFEPPRFFEAFLRGRAFTEVPDITARICGICPVAYQMSSIAAMEDVCGVEVPEPVRALRRLLYCGEWIESHALHVFFLHGPDYLGYDSAFAMARDHRGIVERALQLKKAGNALMRVVGGREIHPVNVRVGGFYRAPTRAELAPVVEELEVAREFARESVAWTAGLPCPDLEEDFEFVALRAPGTYAIESGRLASSSGLDLAPAEYEEHFAEHQVPHSTALHSRLRDGRAYLTGPLARYALSGDRLSPVAREAAADGRARVRLPQPVQEHRGARGRDPLRRRRGAAAARRLRAARPAGRPGRPARRHGLRLDRGAARDALAPLRDRRARARSSTRGSSRRPARTRRGSSRASPPSSPRTPRSRTTSCSSAASRPSAASTPASPAPRTSCGSRSSGADPRGRRREPVARRRRGGAGGRGPGSRAGPGTWSSRRSRATRPRSCTSGRATTTSRSSTRRAPAPRRARCTSSAPATATLPAAALRSSTHAFGVADAVGLAAALGRLPARLEIYAIEGADFSLGAPLSPAVARTVDALATRLLRTRRERHPHLTGVHACGRVGR